MKRQKFAIAKATLHTFCGFVILLLAGCPCPETAIPETQPVTAVVGAFNAEVAPIRAELTAGRTIRIEGIDFVTGTIAGREVVVAWTGIGKVNAAMTTTLLLEHFRPREVIVTGIAGALNPKLGIGDVVIAAKTAQHDLGVWTNAGLENTGEINRLTGEKNPVYFAADKHLLLLAEEAARQITFDAITTTGGERKPAARNGVIVTGDTFVMAPAKRAELQKQLNADAVDMEGAAIAQICHQRRIPHIVIKAVSDSADENAMQDVNVFEKIACKNSAIVVCKLVGLMETHPLTRAISIRE